MRLAPGVAAVVSAPNLARLGADPDQVALRGARGNRRDVFSLEADGAPRCAGVVATKHAAASRAAPGAAFCQWIAHEAGGTVTQTRSWPDVAIARINGEHGAVRGNEKRRHEIAP